MNNWILNGSTIPEIKIQREVNQGCIFSSLFFNLQGSTNGIRNQYNQVDKIVDKISVNWDQSDLNINIAKIKYRALKYYT